MGTNRAGARRKERLKRTKRQDERLAKKRAAATDAGQTGVVVKVKGAAAGGALLGGEVRR